MSKGKPYRKCISTWLSSLLLLFLVSCNTGWGLTPNDPHAIKNHDTRLTIGTDTLSLKTLRIIVVKGDSIRQGIAEGLSQRQARSVIQQISGEAFRYPIVGLELYSRYDLSTPLRKWRIQQSDMAAMSMFYIQNDSLRFAYYPTTSRKFESYGGLSDAYCDIPLMFLMKQEKQTGGDLSLLNLRIDPDEMPAQRNVHLANEENDSLYKAMQRYFRD